MNQATVAPVDLSSTRAIAGRRQSRVGFRITRQVILILFSVFAILPCIFTIFASFKSLLDFYNNPLTLPTTWLWQNYVAVWHDAGIPQAALNSFIVVVIAVPISLAFSCCAAYGLARYSFRGNNVIYYLFLGGLVVPAQLTILPVVLLDKNLGLINTYGGLIFPYIGGNMPFAVFLLAGFLRTLPSELRDAALIDGANEFQVFYQVMLPLLRPALATVAILNAVGIWNDFFFPLVVSPKIPMLQVGVYNLLGVYSTEWGHIFAGVVISAVPLIVAYLLATKQFVAGLSAGAVKG
ncbi:MAG: carbohydrate ABC transporter permease [Candidatus Dormibacteraceae bacterium]